MRGTERALRSSLGQATIVLLVLLLFAVAVAAVGSPTRAISAEGLEALATPGPSSGRTLYLPLIACSTNACSSQATVTGTVRWDTGDPVAQAQVTVRVQGESTTATGTTDDQGRFQISITPQTPNRLLVEVTAILPGYPPVTTGRWSPAPVAAGTVDLGTLVVPDPRHAALQQLAPGIWRRPDNSLVAQNVPDQVASLWARVYNPATYAQAFPGTFADDQDTPLNSGVFLWIAAQDRDGRPVTRLSSPATLRAQVPRSQWAELQDQTPGNGQIDVPIYWYDEDRDVWVRRPNGLLTDIGGNPLDESSLSSLQDGSYAGPVYVQFQADHFSWWNLDYPADCGTEYSDAPEPYPVARHDTGCRAWLGPWADAESGPDRPDRDRFDDGILDLDPLTLGVSNWSWPGLLYLNVLMDLNDDGDWADAGEWVVQNQAVVVPIRGSAQVVTSARWDGQHWMRVTLTGRPLSDYTGDGTFAIGETEDYRAAPFTTVTALALGNGQVYSDPGGIACYFPSTDQCQARLQIGTQVEFRQRANPGSSFQGWAIWEGGSQPLAPAPCAEGSPSGTTCTLTVERDMVVIGQFTGAKVGVTAVLARVTSQPQGIDCANSSPVDNAAQCTEGYPRGTTLVLRAQPQPPATAAIWAVSRWSVGSPEIGTATSCREAGGAPFLQGTTCTLELTEDGTVYTVLVFPAGGGPGGLPAGAR